MVELVETTYLRQNASLHYVFWRFSFTFLEEALNGKKLLNNFSKVAFKLLLLCSMTLLVFTVGCKSNKNAPDGKELVGMSETEFRRTTEIGIDCLKQNYSSKVKSGEIQSVYEVYLKEKEKQNQIITNYTSVDIIDIYLFL